MVQAIGGLFTRSVDSRHDIGVLNGSWVPPAKAARAVEFIRYQVYRLHQRMMPAPVVMLEKIQGAWFAQVITVAAELGIADTLVAGPLSATDIANRVSADPDAVGRLMRSLSGEGIFKQRRDGRYQLNALARTLRSDVPGSLAANARFVGSREHREHWTHLEYGIRTGMSSLQQLRGKPMFEYLADEPKLAEVFNQSMTSFSELAMQFIVAGYDFGRFPVIADIGGGHGGLLAAIVAGNPGSRGVLFDLPNVVDGAAELLRERGVSDRVVIEPGSFFETIPVVADAYVLKMIIHDWPDGEAVEILRNVRAAADPGATVLLVELVIPVHRRGFPGKLSDLEMLVIAAGRERTAQEYGRLLDKSGFRMTRVVQTASPYSMVEGTAV